jgi:hypothetical protein
MTRPQISIADVRHELARIERALHDVYESSKGKHRDQLREAADACVEALASLYRLR